MLRKTKPAATAPMSRAAGKVCAVNVSGTTGKWVNCPPVSFPTTWKKHTTGALKGS